MIRRLICTLTVLAMVMMTYSPARADYLGCFDSRLSYGIEVVTTTQVAVTFLLVTTRGKLEVEEIRVYDQTSVSESRTIPRNAVRLIIQADGSPGGSRGLLKINQGANRFELPIEFHSSAVIDVSPGPIYGGN